MEGRTPHGLFSIIPSADQAHLFDRSISSLIPVEIIVGLWKIKDAEYVAKESYQNWEPDRADKSFANVSCKTYPNYSASIKAMKTANFFPALAIGLTSVVTVGLAAPEAQAAGLVTYNLGNHSDAYAADPGYGLRLDGLDGLLNGAGRHSDRVFTFDFDDIASSMSMTYDTETGEINILGTSVGGVDAGSSYSPGSEVVADIDFTYFYSSVGSGDKLATVDKDESNNGADYGFGTLTVDDVVIELRAKRSGNNYFNLGNNHRGESGLSGWGWLEYRLETEDDSAEWYSGGTSDWLYTANSKPVPEPAMTLGLLAVGGLMVNRRKGSKGV